MAYTSSYHVQGAYADLALKQIIIETNFKIDTSSISMDNILLYKCLEDNTHDRVTNYSLGADKSGKNIIIQFENYPEDNSRYYIIIKNLVDKLGRQLKENYDRYILFSYNIKTKVTITNPVEQYVSNDSNVEIKMATSCEDKGIKYRLEISRDVAFFKSDYIILSDNKEETYVSDNESYGLVGYEIEQSEIKALIKFKTDGQYYIRARAEKNEAIAGKWCNNAISFSISTAESPLKDDSGFLNDFLFSDVLYDEGPEPLKIVSSTSDGTTSQQFFIEFNKDIEFVQDKDSQYSEDGLLYIGKAYMVRRDL